MNNFSFWIDEIADIPEQDKNGNWYDLETGLPFNDTHHYRSGEPLKKWSPSSKIKDFRLVAKFYGGKALTGLPKQKEWSESIRSEKLSDDSLSDTEKKRFIEMGGNVIKSCKFWIDNRHLDPCLFTSENIHYDIKKLISIKEDTYDALLDSNTCNKEKAKESIMKVMDKNVFKLHNLISFPNFDPSSYRY